MLYFNSSHHQHRHHRRQYRHHHHRHQHHPSSIHLIATIAQLVILRYFILCIIANTHGCVIKPLVRVEM